MEDELLSKLNRRDLADAAGVTFLEFRRGLTPRWGMVWTHIALGWLALVALNLGLWKLAGSSLAPGALATGLAVAIAIGYVVAFLQLFLHEAAHHNIHPDRRMNDVLCNLFVSGITGQDVRRYRPFHWEHHKHLGTPKDTEITYFEPLNVRFLLEAAFGVRALRVILLRRRRSASAAERGNAKTVETSFVPFYGMAINGLFVLFLLYNQLWVSAAAWAAGVLVFFPFFGALRQLLEHRSADATANTDYIGVEHGAVHRIFGDGPVASTFGGAGFNRHLLHHWEPALSYTRLADLERFMLDTSFGPLLRERRSTYAQTFGRLFRFGWS